MTPFFCTMKPFLIPVRMYSCRTKTTAEIEKKANLDSLCGCLQSFQVSPTFWLSNRSNLIFQTEYWCVLHNGDSSQHTAGISSPDLYNKKCNYRPRWSHLV